MSSKFVVILVMAMVYFWYLHEQILTCYSCQLRWIKQSMLQQLNFVRTGHWNKKRLLFYVWDYPPDAIGSIHPIRVIVCPTCYACQSIWFDSISGVHFFIATIKWSRSAIHRFSRICALLLAAIQFSSPNWKRFLWHRCKFYGTKTQTCHQFVHMKKEHPIKILSNSCA